MKNSQRLLVQDFTGRMSILPSNQQCHWSVGTLYAVGYIYTPGYSLHSTDQLHRAKPRFSTEFDNALMAIVCLAVKGQDHQAD